MGEPDEEDALPQDAQRKSGRRSISAARKSLAQASLRAISRMSAKLRKSSIASKTGRRSGAGLLRPAPSSASTLASGVVEATGHQQEQQQQDEQQNESPSEPTVLYAWGDNRFGQLMLQGGADAGAQTYDWEPAAPDVERRRVVAVVASASHAIAITNDGALLGAGDNSEGQLDPDADAHAFTAGPLLLQFSLLTRKRVAEAACGEAHTVVRTTDGFVASWGSNELGQLGHSRDADIYHVAPKLVDRFTEPAVQVGCARNSTFILTARGRLFAFGCNRDGVLGLGDEENRASPKLVAGALAGSPVSRIACGARHVCAVTVTGRVYAWGSNRHGQLGLARATDAAGAATSPQRVAVSRVVAHVACGARHTVLLTATQLVYACGSNTRGQLGVSSRVGSDCVSPPRRADLLTGLPGGVAQLVCGDMSTLALLDSGDLYALGDLGSGGRDAGDDADSDHDAPAVAAAPSARRRLARPETDAEREEEEADRDRNNDDDDDDDDANNGSRRRLHGSRRSSNTTTAPNTMSAAVAAALSAGSAVPRHMSALGTAAVRISAGGGAAFAVTASETARRRRSLPRAPDASSVRGVTGPALAARCDEVAAMAPGAARTAAARELLRGGIFDMHALNASFLREHFSSAQRSSPDKFDEKRNCGVDVASMARALSALGDAVLRPEHEHDAKAAAALLMHLRGKLAPLVGELDAAAPSATEPDQLRAYLIALMLPFSAAVPKEHELAVLALQRLPSRSRDMLFSWIKYDLGTELIMELLVAPLLRQLGELVVHFRYDEASEMVTHLLRQLFRITQGRPAAAPTSTGAGEDMARAPHTAFYCAQLDQLRDEDLMRMFDAYRKVLGARKTIRESERVFGRKFTNKAVTALARQFTLFDFPFLLSANVKRRVMQMEDQSTQYRNLVFSQLFLGQPFFVLTVRREHLLEDTLRQIESVNPDEFRKPLKVRFEGEQGLDAGGVRKEFFQLLSAQLFAPDYGMFRPNADTHTLWFNHYDPDTADLQPYLVVGALIGLAIYNSTLLDVQFPLLLWRTLLGKVPERPSLDTLHELDPAMARSLRALLAYDGADFEDVFMQTFEVSVNVFGTRRDVPLRPGGEHEPVTLENRAEYVDLLVRYLTVDSVKPLATALMHGFNRVIAANLASLALFEPDELELAACGSPELDFAALQRVATYEGGYSAEHPTVAAFWRILGTFDHAQKQQFLRFTTGSPKAPVGGLGAVQTFKVQRAGPDSHQLPTAHTCFNTIMVPEYASEGKLRQRLLLAMEHSVGFGLE